MLKASEGVVVCGIPAFNEQLTIAAVVVQAQKYVDEVIVVDDGSTDLTAEIAEKLGAKVLRRGANEGKGAALRELFDEAKEVQASALVTLDADGQHEPDGIPSLLKALRESGDDIVIGSRFLGESGSIPATRRVGNRILTRATSADVTDSQSGFRAYGKRAIERLTPTEMGYAVDSEILIRAREIGLSVGEISMPANYQVPNPSKANPVIHAVGVLLGTVKRYSIQHPMLVYGVTGAVLFLFGLSLSFYALEVWASTHVIYPNVLLSGIGFTIIGTVIASTGLMLWVIISVVRER